MTPDERDCLNMIRGSRDGASSCAQLSNREHRIPSGPAAELEESSLIKSIMIDSIMNNSCCCCCLPQLGLSSSQSRFPLSR